MRGALRSSLGIYSIIALAVIAATLLTIVGYHLYYVTLADTPQKAAHTYLDTLNKGDMMKLYDTTLGAGAQTQSEFAIMISSLVKDKRLTIDGTSMVSIGHQGSSYYYQVTGKLATSDGSYRSLTFILQTAQEANVWRVSLYVPPPALPSSP